MLPITQKRKDLILIGGGHAHALALRMLAMQPMPDVRITLISPASHTPYSGMLPGLIAGHYTFEQTHIDLVRLSEWAQARFICAEVTSIDPVARTVSVPGRPAIGYDVLSLDIGSQPELDSVAGAREFATPVKPVADLWQRWNGFRTASDVTPARIAVVGGGAGGVELVLAMAHRQRGSTQSFDLYCGGDDILVDYNASARRSVYRALEQLGVGVHCGKRVIEVSADALHFGPNDSASFDQLFWCTGAAAAPWVGASGLDVDDRGFLQVDDQLRALNNDQVFAAGDIATQINHPRPKAGVYAVRQAPVLAHNLRAALNATPLRQHRPQKRFLSLVSLGDRRAVADRGPFSLVGDWVWRWKDHIDSTFMRQFSQLPTMSRVSSSPITDIEQEQAPCGGCGAKVDAASLASVLESLSMRYPELVAAAGAEDAVALPGGGAPLWQSVDALREMVRDPFVMGQVAANHALSDLYACGLKPLSALALVTIPFAGDTVAARELEQYLAGALEVFSVAGCVLAGGHSMQGAELNLGFVVNGAPMTAESSALTKRGVRTGDRLILTKPLGTGVVFAANMLHKADGRDVMGAIETMLLSNHAAADVAVTCDASALTDITGFGLAGHLGEMLGPHQQAELFLTKLPLIPGAQDALAQGITSTLHESNVTAFAKTVALDSDLDAAITNILYDPQTSGGLLMAIAPENVEAALLQLAANGCPDAAEIGSLRTLANVEASAEAEASSTRITLRSQRST
ncbi:MAG: selenide, water dikinase SelD [Halioglobus sp.]